MLLGYALREENGIWQDSLGLDNSFGLKGQLVGRLSEFIERLFAWYQTLQHSFNIMQWQQHLTALADDFFGVTTETNETLFYIKDVIQQFAEQLHDVHFEQPLVIDVVADVMNSALEENPNHYRFLAGKVNFCTLLPMRSIPFKVVCLLGMNDGEYPRQQQANSSSATSLVSSVEPSSAAQHAASSSSETSSQAKIDGAEFFGDVQGKRVSGEGEETTYELYAPMNKFKFTVKGKNYVWVGVYEDEEITMDTTVTEGETLDIKVKGQTRSVRIRLGYPEGAEIQVNGKTVKIANDYITDSIVFRLHADQPTGSSTNEAKLRGYKKVVPICVVMFIGYYLVGIPTAYYFVFKQGIGIEGLWIGWIIGLAVYALGVLFYYLYMRREISKKIILAK